MSDAETPRRPAGLTRRVAWFAGCDFKRSRRNVPMACFLDRTVTYFGRSRAFACFLDGRRIFMEPSSVKAALWLLEATDYLIEADYE